jgi:hydroxyethylthiazole kinase
MLEQMLKQVRKEEPLVHVITNFVTVNDCANIILAAGGSPIMTSDIREVEEIVSISQALVLNIGSTDTADAMIVAGKRANERNCPVVFDPVAAGASQLRKGICEKLLKEIQFTVIRGNISEIKAIATGSRSAKGVDANATDAVTEENLESTVKLAKHLSARTGAVIVISGAVDIAADAAQAYVIRNGCQRMSRITGSGCMFTALIGAFCGANPSYPLAASAAAAAVIGISGELADKKTAEQGAGTSSFRNYLIDAVSNFTKEQFERGIHIETY